MSGVEPNPGPVIDNLEIISINCNGLTNDMRLLQAIGKIKKRIRTGQAIVFLQETHNANIALLESVWKGPINISMGTGGSRGVITLGTSELRTTAFKADNDGRYLFTTTKIGDDKYLYSANLYSPNDHIISKAFFHSNVDDWESFCQEQSINLPQNHNLFFTVAGDLNCVVQEWDMQNRTRSRKEMDLAESIVNRMEQCGLYDSVLRSNQGNNFTWCRDKTFSKLDYIFVCKDILKSIKSYDTVWDLVKSDHAAISLKINFNSELKRGKSYPKLNASDIKSKNNYEELRKVIVEEIEGFPTHWNPHQRLDYIKMVIRTKTLELRSRDKINNDTLTKLKADIEFLKSLPHLSDDEAKLFNDTRLLVYEEEEKQAERLKIMAGVRWREEGERSSKFFLNAVTAKQVSTTLDFLSTELGNIYDVDLIVEHAKEFYRSLYSKKDCQPVENFYQNCPQLDEEAKTDLDNSINIVNLKEALKSCKDSTPGLDGIPYSFYKTYGDLLLPIIIDAWEYSNITGKLPESQSISVISLIPKAGKDKHEIKNWRPISISSCDLKIITKALSIKVAKYLDSIISDSQMAYVPGRDINFNNRLLRTALSHCKNKNTDFIIASLDAQKAYDSLDHSYINNTLRAYNFPEKFISQVTLLNSNLQAQVQVNGFMSNRFDIERGVKQGDALSCSLFIIAIDPLIRNIENNDSIAGLSLKDNCNLKTLAYADDVAIVTKNNDESIAQVFLEYMKLTRASGLTLNADKTEILNLSNTGKSTTRASYNELDLNIEHKPAITICGNYLSLSEKDCYQNNVLSKIDKLTTQLNKWKGRNISINGKMIIVKTFAISQLIFTSQFQIIRPKEVKKIESLCYSFVWNGVDRVKRSVIKSGRENGGINGIDVESFFYAIAVRQFEKSKLHSKLNIINICYEIQEDIKTHARLILRKILLKQLADSDIDCSEDAQWIAHTRADLFVKSYSNMHCILNQLKVESMSSIDFESYSRKANGIIRRSLPTKALLALDRYITVANSECKTQIIVNNKKVEILKLGSRQLNDVIKETLRKITNFHPAVRYDLDNTFFGDIRQVWTNLWLIKNPTLRAIRLKVLHKDVWTQEKRCKLGITSSNACEICGEPESVIHQLYTCRNASRIWKSFSIFRNNDDCFKKAFVNLITVSNDNAFETVKSAIFKALIQIDRSQHLSIEQIKKQILYWLQVDMIAISRNSRSKNNKSLIKSYNNIIRKIVS